jgi:hypothetical protein
MLILDGPREIFQASSLRTPGTRYLCLVIPPSDPPTCQVGIEDLGKAYEAVIRSVGNKFEALLSGLSREKIKINLLHVRTIKRSHPGLLARNVCVVSI